MIQLVAVVSTLSTLTLSLKRILPLGEKGLVREKKGLEFDTCFDLGSEPD